MTHHLLLTAWAFPPARTSGVYRAAAIANAFAEGGWDVTVLCGPAALFRANGVVDESLLETLHPRVRTVEVPLEHFELSSDIAQWSWLRARQPEIWTKLRLRRDKKLFPESWYGSWAPALRRAAEHVHRTAPVTLALGTAAPSVDFVPGEYLHERFGVPYVLDYRDAWTFNVFTGGPAPLLTPEIADRERALVGGAHRIWFVNDVIRDWHAAAYPDAAERMRVVRNGFDLPAGITQAHELGAPFRDVASGPLTFGYVGTMSFGSFPFTTVIDGWRAALPDLPEGSRIVLRGHLGRTGEGSPQMLALLEEARSIGIVYEGPVRRDAVWDLYRSFDVLLLALASGPGVTSGKVYEYSATGLPIVSVHAPENPVGEVLGDFPHWTPSSALDADAVARAFVDAARDARTLDERARADAIAFGARWERTRQLKPAVAETTAWAEGEAKP